jgi:hypothetical protein
MAWNSPRARAREWADAMSLRRTILAEAAQASADFEIRYEDLVATPERTLTTLFGFLGEAFDARVLGYYQVERNVTGSEECGSGQAVDLYDLHRPLAHSAR